MLGINKGKLVNPDDIKREILVLVRDRSGTEQASEANIVSAASSKIRRGEVVARKYLNGIHYDEQVRLRNGVYELARKGEIELERLGEQSTKSESAVEEPKAVQRLTS